MLAVVADKYDCMALLTSHIEDWTPKLVAREPEWDKLNPCFTDRAAWALVALYLFQSPVFVDEAIK